MFVCCECSVLSCRGIRDELIARPEESYRLWRVVVCDQETSRAKRPWPAIGPQSHENKEAFYFSKNFNLLHMTQVFLQCFPQQFQTSRVYEYY
jgi:hypothetical protein